MGAARIPFPLDAAFTDADWNQDFAFFLSGWENPDDFRAWISAECHLVRRFADPVETFDVSTDAGTLELRTPNTWCIRQPAAGLASLAAGTWDGQLRLIGPAGEVDALLTFELPLYAGLSAGGSLLADPLGPPSAIGGTINVRRACNGVIEVMRSGAGPMGPAGAPGVITRTAAQNLSGHRVMKAVGAAQTDYASALVAGDAQLIEGISIGAASSGAPVSIQYIGELQDPSFAWTPGLPIFCGLNGVLTQTAPVGAFICQVAVAADTDRLVIGLKAPIMTP